MSIRPRCDRCREELTEPGGLAFSPPSTVDEACAVMKLHICADCWPLFLAWVGEPSPDQDTTCATCGGTGIYCRVEDSSIGPIGLYVPCPSCAPTEPGDAT